MSSYCPPCPACGNTAPAGHGHACVPKPPLFTSEPGRLHYHCHNGCLAPCRCISTGRLGKLPHDWPQPRKRTICADCRWYRRSGFDGATYLTAHHVCAHQNARHLITGDPTPCAQRNAGFCPDYQEKQP